MPVVKTGRTHLQDATPIRLGQEFQGHAGQLDRGIRRLRNATAGLEVEAEHKITETLISLLERVTGLPRRKYREPQGSFAQAVERMRPLRRWVMGGLVPGEGFESGVVCHLPGVVGAGFPDQHRSRAAHFAGGRVVTKAAPGDEYSVSLWFWNGLRTGARPVTGYLFSRGEADNPAAPGDHVGIGGTAVARGKTATCARD